MLVNIRDGCGTSIRIVQKKKKKVLLSHNNQNIKSTAQRKNIKRGKVKRPGNIERQTYQNYI
jgi:ABC-type polysaccharide/polyol phosphate transport system ATPase subunit